MLQILGLVAGAFTSLSATPQLIKTWKSKEVHDVSLRMFLFLTLGNSLWLTYGILKSDVPIIVTNAVAVTCNAAMLYLKIRYNHNSPVTSNK